MVNKTRNAVNILERLTGDDVELQRIVEEEYVNIQIAQMIYDARVAAGLTQTQLAEIISTHQSTIARLEDSDYRGHSLNMLKRIATALNLNLEVRFLPRSVA